MRQLSKNGGKNRNNKNFTSKTIEKQVNLSYASTLFEIIADKYDIICKLYDLCWNTASMTVPVCVVHKSELEFFKWCINRIYI